MQRAARRQRRGKVIDNELPHRPASRCKRAIPAAWRCRTGGRARSPGPATAQSTASVPVRPPAAENTSGHHDDSSRLISPGSVLPIRRAASPQKATRHTPATPSRQRTSQRRVPEKEPEIGHPAREPQVPGAGKPGGRAARGWRRHSTNRVEKIRGQRGSDSAMAHSSTTWAVAPENTKTPEVIVRTAESTNSPRPSSGSHR